MIKPAKITYSPLKPNEDQAEKQMKTLDENGKQLFKSTNEKESLVLLKQKESFDELAN